MVLLTFNLVSAQKIEKPIHLGDWTLGEDPSEFILHLVMERSEFLLKDNANGKLIIRICGSSNFSESFVKASLNPFYITYFNHFRVIVPVEKIFVANYSKCSEKRGFVFNQYWFVPEEVTFDYKEIYPINKINTKYFSVKDFKNDRDGSLKKKRIKFAENIEEFIKALSKDRTAEGLIIHNSKKKSMRQNIAKVYELAAEMKIDSKRIKTIRNQKLDYRIKENDDIEVYLVEDDGDVYPDLMILSIKE